MAYKLMKGGLLVLLDDGKDNRGTVFQSNLGGYRGLVIPISPPEDPEGPTPPIEYYDHVVFIKNMPETVTIDGTDYQAMYRNALVGVIPD